MEENLRGFMAQRKSSKPFSRVKSRQLLDPRKTWNVLSNRVCGERPTKYFSRNKLPTRFAEDIAKCTTDGRWRSVQGKASSEDEIFLVWVNSDIPAPCTGFAIIPWQHI